MTPRVSVGLPVYDGQQFLAESLDALLGQSYGDVELIISDNASTDATEEICRSYAAADSRVRYIRQERNIGAAPNHNVLIDEARGELFKWASHDDLYGQDLLKRCVEALDERPEVVVAHADMAIVDEHGEVAFKYEYTMNTASPDPVERFHSLLVTDGGDDEYGVIRMPVLRRIARYGSYHNPGRTFITELALHGPFHQVPELLYFRRDHPGRTDRQPGIKAVCARLDPAREGQSTARLVGEYLWGFHTAVRRAPISSADKRRCYRALAQWLTRRATTRTGRPIGPAAVPAAAQTQP